MWYFPMMNDTDKKILNRIQADFPIEERPFLVIAQEMGMEEDQVIQRIKAMKDGGIIRRIGGNFSPASLGYVSTLCAAKVPEEKIEMFAQTVNAYPGVTHNYLRSHELNIWFTMIAQGRDKITENLHRISEKTGIGEIYNLPATRLFKIAANFKL